MATFNQDKQTVYGDQYMGDTVNVTHGERSSIDARTVTREFDRAIAALHESEIPADARGHATAELTAARAELEAGKTGAARGRLAALVGVSDSVAKIVNNFAHAAGVILNG